MTQRFAAARPAGPPAAAPAQRRLDPGNSSDPVQLVSDLSAALGFLGGPAESVEASIDRSNTAPITQRAAGEAATAGVSTGGASGGLPAALQAGIESMSGMDLSDVRVHQGSSKPAELGALAYAQGSDIHLGPGQEEHLPHEAWHVVQQRQGRVSATTQFAGVAGNDDAALEREADVMGARALTLGQTAQLRRATPAAAPAGGGGEVAQLVKVDFGDKKISRGGHVNDHIYGDYSGVSEDDKAKLIAANNKTYFSKEVVEEIGVEEHLWSLASKANSAESWVQKAQTGKWHNFQVEILGDDGIVYSVMINIADEIKISGFPRKNMTHPSMILNL